MVAATAVLPLALLFGCSTPTTSNTTDDNESELFTPDSDDSSKPKNILEAIFESGHYTTRDSVAAYLCKFDKLPSNYVGKNKGQELYESKTGNNFSKWNFNPWTTLGVMIGGDTFSNNEGLLPNGSYHEADVDYSAANRGTKRLVYQSGCIIYYTADHYETFKQIEF